VNVAAWTTDMEAEFIRMIREKDDQAAFDGYVGSRHKRVAWGRLDRAEIVRQIENLQRRPADCT